MKRFKGSVMKRFKYQKKQGLIRGMAHNARLFDKAELAHALMSLTETLGFQDVKYVDEGNHLRDIPNGGLLDCIPNSPDTTPMLAFRGGDLSFNWSPPEILVGKWRYNLAITLGFDAIERIELLRALESCIESCGIFGAEANDRTIVDPPTFCGPNAHYLEVPKIGMVNYFGAEYVRYFGGEDRFTSAPHVATSIVSGGVLTVLGKCSDTTDFEKKQAAVMAHLGNELFEVGDGGIAIHQRLFWDKDNTSNVTDHADATWQRIEQAGKGLK